MAWVTFLFLSSNEPAQPTQYRYSASRLSPGSTICTPSMPSAQSARSPWLRPHGLPWFSMARYALPNSAGKFDSISDR